MRLTNHILAQYSELHSGETLGSAILMLKKNHNLHRHRSSEGYCENIPQGAVRVELWVGQCSGQALGNARTGWNSVSRTMIEEVSRPQS